METALNNPKVSFEDFYEVPDLKFDIDRLRKDLDLILKEKKFFTKDDINKLAFSDRETSNELSQKSFVQKFLTSLRDKMYKKK